MQEREDSFEEFLLSELVSLFGVFSWFSSDDFMVLFLFFSPGVLNGQHALKNLARSLLHGLSTEVRRCQGWWLFGSPTKDLRKSWKTVEVAGSVHW